MTTIIRIHMNGGDSRVTPPQERQSPDGEFFTHENADGLTLGRRGPDGIDAIHFGKDGKTTHIRTGMKALDPNNSWRNGTASPDSTLGKILGDRPERPNDLMRPIDNVKSFLEQLADHNRSPLERFILDLIKTGHLDSRQFNGPGHAARRGGDLIIVMDR